MIPPLAALVRFHELTLETSAQADAVSRLAEKNRLLTSMSPDLQKHYAKIQRRHGISAVVPMKRGVCTGCFVRQPARPVEVDEEVYECFQCNRLLYDPDVAYELSVG